MKQIAYIITDSGVDGREPTRIVTATYTEAERAALLANDTARNWRSVAEVIIDPVSARAQALAKLDGVDRLALGLPSWHAETYPAPAHVVRPNRPV